MSGSGLSLVEKTFYALRLALTEENTSEHFVPGYMVAVDHEAGCVVVALRGTSTARDALVDLVCEAVPCELAGMEGLAHGGMLRAAKRLMEPLLAHVKEGLSLLAAERAQGRSTSTFGTDVLVTGHSLGGGVAALLAALWRDAAALPVGCSMRCVTFGCPQVLDASHAVALSNFTT
ncbi:Dagla, partial [Symbiodinium sp. CCMP2592]